MGGEGEGVGTVKLVGLIETHEKYRRISWPDGVDIVEEMREMGDKRGGGLMIWKNSVTGGIRIEKVETACREFLMVRVVARGFEFLMIVVYLDTGDLYRNRNIYSIQIIKK